MAREFFKDYPDTTTPLSSERINGLLDGDEAMGNIVVDSISSKNLISGWNYGGISSTDGSDFADNSSRRTDYLPVNISSSLSYTLSGLVINQCSMFIAAYNASKVFLGRTGAMIQTSTTNLTLSTTSFPSGTPQGTGDIKYLRIVLYSPASGYTIDSILASNSNMQLEKGSTITDFAPYQNTNGQIIYSTVERKIGTWIDGKNIYRKVITFNPRTDVLETTHSHGISNISEVLPTSCCLLHRTSNQFVPISMAYPSSASAILEWSAGWQVSTTQITTWLGSSLRGQIDTTTYGAVAIIEYTKTTD